MSVRISQSFGSILKGALCNVVFGWKIVEEEFSENLYFQ
ncbi:hypothetical protein M109_0342 [Bacteroides fragilis str. 3397 N2]|nr:hypothetical protein M109_0342 [Bacteroides fragilis str. 3397 N2]EXZ55646.1 hypothetical protein M108_0339 [Bacteroides fragilis str. 3397 T14]EYA45638.1 hypothetical protein M110_0345 [Bacteroides fragilis str. 3397 N3]